MEHENGKIFDGLAPEYENEWTKPGPARDKVKKIVSLFGLKKGMKVVEPGCGRGDFSRFILDKIGRKGRLFAIDASEKMALSARRALKNFRNAKVARGCASSMKACGGSADAVICFNCFPHFYPKEGFIREFLRVLRPGGALVIAHDINREKINSMHRRYGFDMKKHSLPSIRALSFMLEKSGFKVLKKREKGMFFIKAVKG